MPVERTVLHIAVAGDDAASRDDEAHALRRELLRLDVDAVDHGTRGTAPPGAKTLDMPDLGALLVTFATSGAVMEQVVALVRSWVDRGRDRRVELQIDDARLIIERADRGEQRRLVDAWLRQVGVHAGTGTDTATEG